MNIARISIDENSVRIVQILDLESTNTFAVIWYNSSSYYGVSSFDKDSYNIAINYT